jgi:hypothetical protein
MIADTPFGRWDDARLEASKKSASAEKFNIHHNLRATGCEAVPVLANFLTPSNRGIRGRRSSGMRTVLAWKRKPHQARVVCAWSRTGAPRMALQRLIGQRLAAQSTRGGLGLGCRLAKCDVTVLALQQLLLHRKISQWPARSDPCARRSGKGCSCHRLHRPGLWLTSRCNS